MPALTVWHQFDANLAIEDRKHDKMKGRSFLSQDASSSNKKRLKRFSQIEGLLPTWQAR